MSYYEMKNRAGVIGRSGLGPMLGKLAAADPGIRIHLMGHSFGARLVAYSLSGLPPLQTGAHSPVKIAVPDPGRVLPLRLRLTRFRRPGQLGPARCRPRRVNGPLLATFTAADRAVGWWYPAASMLAHQDAESATDLTYQWGGMGHDGYQQSRHRPRLMLQPQGTPYGFQSGIFYLLDANAIISANQSPFSGAHSDIRHPEVLWAVVSAAGLSA